jgi:hypothetical protein
MDDERLKNPGNIFGKDYFDEQLARIGGFKAKITNRILTKKLRNLKSKVANPFEVLTIFPF